MPIVYICQYICDYDGEKSMTVWETEPAAYKHAAYNIQCTVQDRWDMTNETERDDARNINNHIKSCNYRSAVRYFNDCDANSDDHQEIWSIYSEDVNDSASDPKIFPDSHFDSDEDDDVDDASSNTNAADKPFQATESGATCRGPCGGYNEYAYADKRDGTFVCYACKIMSQTFSA